MTYTRKPDVSGMRPEEAVKELERCIRLMMEQTERAVSALEKGLRRTEQRLAELEREE